MIATQTDPRVCLVGHPAPAWMVNYADLMTELVCFFIVLYALSASLNKDVQKAKKDVEEKMKEEKVATEVKITKDGMTITLEENGENVFFDSGNADLSPRMVEILGKLSPSLKTLAKSRPRHHRRRPHRRRSHPQRLLRVELGALHRAGDERRSIHDPGTEHAAQSHGSHWLWAVSSARPQ